MRNSDEPVRPTRARMIVSLIATILLVVAIWKFIHWRMQPPAPASLRAESKNAGAKP